MVKMEMTRALFLRSSQLEFSHETLIEHLLCAKPLAWHCTRDRLMADVCVRQCGPYKLVQRTDLESVKWVQPVTEGSRTTGEVQGKAVSMGEGVKLSIGWWD